MITQLIKFGSVVTVWTTFWKRLERSSLINIANSMGSGEKRYPNRWIPNVFVRTRKRLFLIIALVNNNEKFCSPTNSLLAKAIPGLY